MAKNQVFATISFVKKLVVGLLLWVSGFGVTFAESLIGKTEEEIAVKYGTPTSVMDFGDTKTVTYSAATFEFQNGKVVKQTGGSGSPARAAPGGTLAQKAAAEPTVDRPTIRFAEVGQPLELSFTAVDGTSIDLKNYQGKVVLIDFWATWCGPCVAEIPHVKQVYSKYHDKGFEIIGISLDKDKQKLLDFVKANEMPWPQYFDGQGWKNEIAKKHGIQGIPALWLVNKKGEVVSKDVRGKLEAAVELEVAK
jgi:thiol-disulfide isomerase/thioredoxin